MLSFRGIDPDGLEGLAGGLRMATERARTATLPAIGVLDRNGLGSAAGDLAVTSARVDRWGTDTATTLLWRADTIRHGQGSRFNIGDHLRASFAAGAVFSATTIDEAFNRWLAEWHASRRRGELAAAAIAEWLHQGWTDLDVSNGDLHNIRDTLASLTGPELDRVLATLSSARLERWIAEMGHSFNGFSRREKQEVFAMLATNASGRSLGRVHDAILATAGEEELTDFGFAIQAASNDPVIEGFVRYAVSQNLASHPYSGLVPGLAIAGVDSDQSATGVTKTILQTDSALAALIVECLVQRPERLDEIMATLSRTTDMEDRAIAFSALAGVAASKGRLRELIEVARSDDYGAEEVIQARHGFLMAATSFLESDPEATFEHLATTLDPTGQLTSAYWYQMVDHGQAGTIADILRGLRGGDEVDLVTFAAEGADPSYRYPHAGNLAFAAATLNLGLTQSADEADDDIDTIAMVAGIALTIAGALSGVTEIVSALGGTGADLVIDTYADSTKDDIRTQLKALIDQVSAQLRPPEGTAPGVIPGLDGAMMAWTDLYLALLPFA